jgi:hypothetical protein
MVAIGKWLPALLLAAFCLWSGAGQFREVFLNRPASPPGTTQQERYHARFDRARHALRGMDLVGYVRVGPDEQQIFVGRAHYFAQYALAPTLLSTSFQTPYVLGDFDSSERRDAFLRQTGLRLLEDLGSGLALLENPRAR